VNAATRDRAAVELVARPAILVELAPHVVERRAQDAGRRGARAPPPGLGETRYGKACGHRGDEQLAERRLDDVVAYVDEPLRTAAARNCASSSV
jgi:hypothetical protein